MKKFLIKLLASLTGAMKNSGNLSHVLVGLSGGYCVC